MIYLFKWKGKRYPYTSLLLLKGCSQDPQQQQKKPRGGDDIPLLSPHSPHMAVDFTLLTRSDNATSGAVPAPLLHYEPATTGDKGSASESSAHTKKFTFSMDVLCYAPFTSKSRLDGSLFDRLAEALSAQMELMAVYATDLLTAPPSSPFSSEPHIEVQVVCVCVCVRMNQLQSGVSAIDFLWEVDFEKEITDGQQRCVHAPHLWKGWR